MHFLTNETCFIVNYPNLSSSCVSSEALEHIQSRQNSFLVSMKWQRSTTGKDKCRMQCITTIILFVLQINNSSDAPSIADNRETGNGRTITTIIDIHEWAIIRVFLHFKRMTTVIRTRIVLPGRTTHVYHLGLN